MKIKLGTKENGEGAVFDFDWKLTIIDRTKKPFKNRKLTNGRE